MSDDDKTLGSIPAVAQFIRDRVGYTYDGKSPVVTDDALTKFGFTPDAVKEITGGKEAVSANDARLAIEKLLNKVDSKESKGQLSEKEWGQFAKANLDKNAPESTTKSVPATLLANPNPHGMRSGREG